MKHLKLKLGLSVLALACLGAGVVTLQSDVNAKAEFSGDVSGLKMANGASVCLMDDFSGIRWKTTVDATWYNTLKESATTIQFGCLVAPTSTEELTIDTANVANLPVSSDFTVGEKDTIFYSVIDYNNIVANYEGELTEEEVLKKAYSLELTARAYVVVDGVYYYADLTGINTSRSARQVAVAAELSGEIDDKYRDENAETYSVEKANKAVAYYGAAKKHKPIAKSVGAAGTAVIDLENITTPVTVNNFTVEGTVEEILVGAESITATYANGTLTITEANYIPTGEEYLTVFTDTGVYSAPIVCATKVFDEISDFEMFSYIRRNVDDNGTGKIAAEMQEGVEVEKCKHNGYYVLKGNIDGSKNLDGTPYVQPADTIKVNGWRGNSDFVDTGLGLTGTFNGMGFAVENFTQTNTYGGLFELINGGTIKNFALTNLKMAEDKTYVNGFAYLAIDPTIENVYIHIDYGCTMVTQVGMFTYIYQTAAKTAVLKNVFLDCMMIPSDSATQVRGGALFAIVGGNRNLQWKNVYAVSNLALAHRVNSKGQVYNYGYAENEVNTEAEKGFTYVAPEGKDTNITYHSKSFEAYYCKGSYRYTSMEEFKTGTEEHNLADKFENSSNCWTVVDGVPTWNSLVAQN